MSHTYLDWAKRNFALNGVHGDATASCGPTASPGSPRTTSAALRPHLLDPPTFSNSKRMDREFDVQRDHVALIRATLRRLAPGGVLLFSNNFRKFKMDAAALADLDVRDITKGQSPSISSGMRRCTAASRSGAASRRQRGLRPTRRRVGAASSFE